MTPTEFKTLKELISKSLNNSHNIGIDLDVFIKTNDSNFNTVKLQNETIINNQHIINSKLNELLANK